MTVRYVHTGYEYVDDFSGGGFTDQIPDILAYFEKFDSYSKGQAETLEVVLLNFWGEFQRMGDMTVRLTETYVSAYTSHRSGNTHNGSFECSINQRGDLQIHISNAHPMSFGTLMYTPWKELKWDRFRQEISAWVNWSGMGLRS